MDLTQPVLPDNPITTNIEADEITEIWRAISRANLTAIGLNGLVSNYYLSDFKIEPGFGSIESVDLIDPGRPPTVPTSPTLPDTSLPTIPVPGDFIPVEYTGESYSFPDDITSMNLPDEIINGNEVQAYISALLSTVQDSLLDRLTTPGTGISSAVQSLIFEREEIRSMASYLESRGRISTDLSSRGLDIPAGILANSVSSLDTKFHNIRSRVGREINIKKEELTQLTTKQSLDLASQLETHLMSYQASFQELLHENNMAMQRAAEEIYKVWLGIRSFYQDAVKQYYQWIAGVADIKIEYNKSVILRYAAEVEYFSTKVVSTMNRVIILLKTYEADILRYKALMSQYVSESKSDIKDLNTEVGNVIGKSSVSLMAADATVQTNIDEAQYKVRSMISAGQAAEMIAAGCVANVKVNTSISTYVSGKTDSSLQHNTSYKETA